MNETLDDILGGEELNTLRVEASDEEIRRIAELANKQIGLLREVQALEEQLKVTKEYLRNVQEHDLPDALAEAGVSEIRLADGSRVKAEPFVNASISKTKQEEAHQWLIDNGHGDIIKREIQCRFGKGDPNFDKVLKAINAVGLNPETKESVHHMTLKGFAREQIENGADIPVDLFNLYTGFKATIAK